MKQLRVILTMLLVLSSLSFAKPFELIVTPSHEDEVLEEQIKPTDSSKKLLIMISSGEIEKAGMGLALGLSAAKKGISVTYVIGAKALNFAKKEGLQNQFLAKSMTHRKMLEEAIQSGAKVNICYMCAKALGLTEKDFIEGARIVKSQVIFDTLYQEGTKVLSF